MSPRRRSRWSAGSTASSRSGPPGEGTAIIIGEVLLWHVHDDLLVNGRIDMGRLDAIGRMAGAGYVRTRDRFDMVRPPK